MDSDSRSLPVPQAKQTPAGAPSRYHIEMAGNAQEQ
jgi:hypothetical protein